MEVGETEMSGVLARKWILHAAILGVLVKMVWRRYIHVI
jgi:hypothetical protein